MHLCEPVKDRLESNGDRSSNAEEQKQARADQLNRMVTNIRQNKMHKIGMTQGVT